MDAYNIHEARAPFDRVRKVRLAILEEKQHGDMADQAKISYLYKQLDIEFDTLKQMVEAGLKAS